MMERVTYRRETCAATRVLDDQDDAFLVAEEMQHALLRLVRDGGHAFVLDGFRMQCDMVVRPDLEGRPVWLRRIRMWADAWMDVSADHLERVSQFRTGQHHVDMVVMEPITLVDML